MSVGPKPDFPRERETQREKENDCFVSITCIHQSIVFNKPNSGRHFFVLLMMDINLKEKKHGKPTNVVNR